MSIAPRDDEIRVVPINSGVEQRHRVDKVGNLSIEIYPNDHNPPHYHVVKEGKKVASVSIDSGSTQKGYLAPKDHKTVNNWQSVPTNQAKLVTKWRDKRPTDRP